jgi:hypothetical protein
MAKESNMFKNNVKFGTFCCFNFNYFNLNGVDGPLSRHKILKEYSYSSLD